MSAPPRFSLLTGTRNRAALIGATIESVLAQPGLIPSEVRAFRGFHTRESAALAAESCFAGQFEETKEWARRGCRKNQLWPLSFGRRLIGHSVGL